MKPSDLLIRCYAERKDGYWQAFCLDFCLAAQGDSLPDVKKKLNLMVREYLYDALVGQDKEYAGSLLRRRAPMQYWLKFYAYVAMYKLGAFHKHFAEFASPMPMVPSPLANNKC